MVPSEQHAVTLDDFFAGRECSRRIFDALAGAIADIGTSSLQLSKSQVGFRRRRVFARAWIPGMYLRGEHAPLVLTVSLRRRDSSER